MINLNIENNIIKGYSNDLEWNDKDSYLIDKDIICFCFYLY